MRAAKIALACSMIFTLSQIILIDYVAGALAVILVLSAWVHGVLSERYPRWEVNPPHSWGGRYSVRLVGEESGQVSPPLRFIRFRRREHAEQWIEERADPSSAMKALTRYEVVDLRQRRLRQRSS